MKLAFCLFKYFPFGGLQRDFLRIAKECLRRGHLLDIFTMEWEGDKLSGATLHLIPSKGLQNHTRAQNFAKQVSSRLNSYDLVVGFNKMPKLDVYYAADGCYQAKAYKDHTFLYRLTSRYRQWMSFEQQVFSASGTKILLLSKLQKQEFIHYYQTPAERFHLLPPGIEKNRVAGKDCKEIRKTTRAEFGLSDQDLLLLMVGSGFKTKGLDRALIALASLPNELRKQTHLYVIGKDHPQRFMKIAKHLKINSHIKFLGGRYDVPRFLFAADLLLHPAYNENTGTVLLEALAAGLPVITTEICGYAEYINLAKAGVVLPSPFNQNTFNEILQKSLISPERNTWQQNASNFTKNADIFHMPERAVSFLEAVVKNK